jgi:hypothetical protein
MAVFGTGDLRNLPRNISDRMVKAAQTGSVVAALSAREPQRFGPVDIITFDEFPRAEFVEEGADKASTGGAFGSVTALPHKAHVTMRFNQEVQWADEDHQLGVLNTLSDAGAIALQRALDFGVLYRTNPLTGNEIEAWTNYLNVTTNRVTSGESAELDIEAAIGLLVGLEQPVDGIAFNGAFGWALATERDNEGNRKYPDLGFGQQITSFNGLRAAVSSTVAGTPEITGGTGVNAITGDWADGVRWGVQREIPLELIQYGDPDGQGDLKRKNQIALRLEIVYGWYVFVDRFAVVEQAEPA